MAVYANRSGKDTVRRAFYDLSGGAMSVRLATPFFSYAELLKEIAVGKDVFLIVRLGPATAATELRKVALLPNVQVRFFTSPLFHTKLYIFGDRAALVGSANLTDSGMQRNREAAVRIDAGTDDFDELVGLFESYWSAAHVLTPEVLNEFDAICRRHPQQVAGSLESEILSSLGLVAPAEGIQEGEKIPSAKLYLRDYRQTYQSFEKAYREVEHVYSQRGQRKAPEVPLRIEVDQFLNFIQETCFKGEEWGEAPLRSAESRDVETHSLLDVWFQSNWAYLTDKVVPNYHVISQRLGTQAAIRNADFPQILDAVQVCHAFSSRYRHFEGGLATLRNEFRDSNELGRVKESLLYLLHGSDDYVARMGAVINEPKYKLANCGRSLVQELLGWVNNEGVAICNKRTLKVLRYMGHDIRVG